MLQNQLKYLGYYNGPISNKFGYELYLAVRSFQRVNGLKVDGIAGPNTLAVINSLDGKTQFKARPDVKRLRYGDKNEDVKKFRSA